MKVRTRPLALLWVLLLLFASCGSDSDRIAVAHDDELSASLTEAREKAEIRRLAELTTFAWDEVYVFVGDPTGEEINDVVGQVVVGEDYLLLENDLLVFLQSGEVVRAVTVNGANFTPQPGEWYVEASPEAWLGPVYAAQLPGSPPGWLRLTEQRPAE